MQILAYGANITFKHYYIVTSGTNAKDKIQNKDTNVSKTVISSCRQSKQVLSMIYPIHMINQPPTLHKF